MPPPVQVATVLACQLQESQRRHCVQVNYRESITQAAPFDYTHKKQSGGSGQFGKVTGTIEPLPEGSGEKLDFVNRLVGTDIPGQFVPSIEKGFAEAMASGQLTGHPVEARSCSPSSLRVTVCERSREARAEQRVQGIRVTIQGGGSHPVDSSDVAFRLAAIGAFRQAFGKAGPVVLEPQMSVEVRAPVEHQGSIMGDLNRRRGMIQDATSEAEDTVITAVVRSAACDTQFRGAGTETGGKAGACVQVPLSEMFGYSNALRSQTAGKGEFSMEFQSHAAVPAEKQAELTGHYKAAR